MHALDPDKYEMLPIGITPGGHWVSGPDALAALKAGAASTMQPVALVGAPLERALMAIEPDRHTGRRALRDMARLDVVFPVLHGPFGEDGTVQGLLELAGIPYVGSGVLGSAVGMDKAMFKAVMLAHGLPVLPYRLVSRARWESDPERLLAVVEADMDYPVFVKPANMGSSVGITKAGDRAALAAGLNEAARYDRRLLVEPGIVAREIEVSVLGNDEVLASVPGEVVPSDEFYSYRAKYIDNASELRIPAPLPDEMAGQVRDLAVQTFRAIDGAGLARVDLLLEVDTDTLYINEINTLPGFTEISMYPKLWEASGLSYPALIDRLVELAIERHEDKTRNESRRLVVEQGQ